MNRRQFLTGSTALLTTAALGGPAFIKPRNLGKSTVPVSVDSVGMEAPGWIIMNPVDYATLTGDMSARAAAEFNAKHRIYRDSYIPVGSRLVSSAEPCSYKGRTFWVDPDEPCTVRYLGEPF